MLKNITEVRHFDESSPDKLVVYCINGQNYSEAVVKALLEDVLENKDA